jgi:hypothetical protein
MRAARKINPQYITDNKGKKTAVILSMVEYQELIEDLADLGARAERRDEPTIPHARVVAELKQSIRSVSS